MVKKCLNSQGKRYIRIYNPGHSKLKFQYKFDSFKLKKQQMEVFYKKGILRISQNSQENSYARVSFLMKLQANSFFTEHVLVIASEVKRNLTSSESNFKYALPQKLLNKLRQWLLGNQQTLGKSPTALTICTKAKDQRFLLLSNFT